MFPQVSIYLQHIQKKGKHISVPGYCGSCILQCNRYLETCIVQVHRIFVFVVVVHSICLIKNYPLPTNCTGFFFPHPLLYPINGHQHHGLVFLFHSEDTKIHIIKIITKCIHSPNILIGEVIPDVFVMESNDSYCWEQLHILTYYYYPSTPVEHRYYNLTQQHYLFCEIFWSGTILTRHFHYFWIFRGGSSAVAYM